MKWGLLLIPLVLFAFPMALAEEDTAAPTTEPTTEPTTATEPEEVAGDPGTTPDSPLWGIDVALDRIKLRLAKDKAATGLLIAQERLLEMQAMGKKNNAAAVEKAEVEHGKTIDEVKKSVEEMDGVPATSEKITGIKLGMQNHLAALAKVRAKIEANQNISPEVKAKLLAKIDNQVSKAEEVQTKVENKKAQIALKESAGKGAEETGTETAGEEEQGEQSQAAGAGGQGEGQGKPAAEETETENESESE